MIYKHHEDLLRPSNFKTKSLVLRHLIKNDLRFLKEHLAKALNICKNIYSKRILWEEFFRSM